MKDSLAEILASARRQGASSVLFLVGHPPVARVAGQLQKPMREERLTFQETQEIAEFFLTDPVLAGALDETGSTECPFETGGVRGRVSIFYGLGCHNLVFHLEDPASA